MTGILKECRDVFLAARRTKKKENSMKTVFITGGATGIGAAAVGKFLEEGWQVVFMDTNAEAAGKLCEEWKGAALTFVSGDTRNRDDLQKAMDVVVSRGGQLDSIIANAGIHRRNTLLNVTDEELDLVIDVNIRGTIRTLQMAVPYLKMPGGSVVINASDQSRIGKANSFAYGLTKGALGQMTKSMAIDLGPVGIRVNAVCPGTIRTPLAEQAMRTAAAINGADLGKYWEEEADLFPLKRVGEAREVAELMYFLASDAASFCTGGLYAVDGGLTAG